MVAAALTLGQCRRVGLALSCGEELAHVRRVRPPITAKGRSVYAIMSAGRFRPFEPLGILAAPLFEQALDNSQQFCLGWGFTLGKETVDIKLRSPAL